MVKTLPLEKDAGCIYPIYNCWRSDLPKSNFGNASGYSYKLEVQMLMSWQCWSISTTRKTELTTGILDSNSECR